MIQVSLVSPERVLFEGEAKYVCLPGAKAPFTVFPGHTSLISMLEPGHIYISTPDDMGRYSVDGGFAEIVNNHVTILVDKAKAPLEIDLEEEKRALAEVSKSVAVTDEEIQEKEKQEQIHRVRIRLVEGEYAR